MFLSVLTQGARATLSGEVIAKPVSLAQQCRVIKDSNYSPESSVKARTLSRHDYDSPLREDRDAGSGGWGAWLLCAVASVHPGELGYRLLSWVLCSPVRQL